MSAGATVVLVVILAIAVPLGLWALVRAEHDRRQTMDREAAQQVARRDTREAAERGGRRDIRDE